MIRFLDAFADFNPLEDELSEELFWEVGYVLQHARKLLPEDYTILDLNAGLEILFQFNRQTTTPTMNYWSKFFEGQPGQQLTFTAPLEHFLCTEYVDEGVRPNGESFPWSALFAVAALASISDYVALIRKVVYEFMPVDDSDIMQNYNNGLGDVEQGYKTTLLSEAMESLGFARLFTDREAIKASHKKRGKGISKQKIANYHPVKLAVVKHFNTLAESLSARKASKIIYSELSEDLKSKIYNDDPEKQIEIWLGQYKNGTLPGQEDLPPYNA